MKTISTAIFTLFYFFIIKGLHLNLMVRKLYAQDVDQILKYLKNSLLIMNELLVTSGTAFVIKFLNKTSRIHYLLNQNCVIFFLIRLQMGDELSKRKKFIFVTWIGPEVSVIQRAKMSTDKAIIKDVLNVIWFFNIFNHSAKFLSAIFSYFYIFSEFCCWAPSWITIRSRFEFVHWCLESSWWC